MPLPPLSSSARRFGHLRTLLLLLLVVLPTLGLVPQDVAFSALPDLELDLGSAYGLTGEGVAQATVMTVTQGAEKKNKESVYFLGLLHLYGAGGMQEDHEKGVASVREAAELGHVEAMTAMGMLLLHGIGVPEDETAAAAWLRKAAAEVDKDAQWILGKLLFEVEDRRARSVGFDGRADFREATALLEASAKQEAKEALYYLGLMHEYGKGVPQDHLKAYGYYRQSANQGYVQALYNLALMVAYGRGVNQDYKEAYTMFRDGAGRNHAPSMYYCGVFSLYGHGIDVDYSQALLWFQQAAQMEDPHISPQAALARDELSASLAKAKKVNGEIMAGFEAPMAEEPAAFATYDVGLVEEAEAEVEAGIARARAEREDAEAEALREASREREEAATREFEHFDPFAGEGGGAIDRLEEEEGGEEDIYGDDFGYGDFGGGGGGGETMKRAGNFEVDYSDLGGLTGDPYIDDPYGDGLVTDFSGEYDDFS